MAASNPGDVVLDPDTPAAKEQTMDEKDLREAAREEIEALPAETAAGNVDADSDGPDTAFDGEADSTT